MNKYISLIKILSIRSQYEKEIFYLYLAESCPVRMFQHQLVALSVIGKRDDDDGFTMNMRANLFIYILTMFTNLLHLKFYQDFNNPTGFMLFNNRPLEFSSTLVELHINLYLFDDCLYLLDGRFNQLRMLFVDVFHIWSIRSNINNKVR